MELSLSRDELKDYVKRQIACFFPDRMNVSWGGTVDAAYNLALERVEYCFDRIAVRNYHNEQDAPKFNHLHSDQYSQFLYYFANSLYRLEGPLVLADKLIVLNRTLHGLWFSYKNHLPDVFILVHPLGTILGNALYSNYLVVLQNVTVNTGLDADGNLALKLGKGLFLGAGSSVIGTEEIGDCVSLGVGVTIHNRSIPSNTCLYRDATTGELMQMMQKEPSAQYYFRPRLKESLIK